MKRSIFPLFASIDVKPGTSEVSDIEIFDAVRKTSWIAFANGAGWAALILGFVGFARHADLFSAVSALVGAAMVFTGYIMTITSRP